jgi:hypothetical protein
MVVTTVRDYIRKMHEDAAEAGRSELGAPQSTVVRPVPFYIQGRARAQG